MPAPAPPDEVPSAAARLLALAPPVAGWTPRQDAAEPAAVAATVHRESWRDRLSDPTHRRTLAWLLLAGVVVIALGGFGLSRHHAGSGASAAPVVASAPTVAAPPPAAQIVVDVGGHVRHPGLVTLSAGARVADAIAAAGGAVNSADVATLDLAAHVSDGELLLVGVPGGAATSGAGGQASGPLSLNTATVEQLDALPGVGPVLAQRIVSWRDAHGGFRTVDQLQQVPGIGARKYADLKPLVAI